MSFALCVHWLLLSKNCCAKNPLDRVSDRCQAKLDEQLPREGEHRHLSRGLVRHDDDVATRNSVHAGLAAKRESC